VDITISGDVRLRTAQLRRDEPWFPDAFAALEAIVAGRATDDAWSSIAPFSYGRWDDEARAHRAAEDEQRNEAAALAFGADGAFDPPATRAALARLASPVLLLAGEVDLNSPPPAMAAFAELFADAELVVQRGAGHFPWLDDPGRFAATIATFLG